MLIRCEKQKFKMVQDTICEVNLTPELVQRAQKRLDFIAREGCTVNGVDQTIDTSIRPDWYDEERFRRGQELLRKYYTA